MAADRHSGRGLGPVEYTRGLRRTATVSWLAGLLVVVVLAAARLVPLGPTSPFLALLLGAPPIAA
jgi:hypothetical protein